MQKKNRDKLFVVRMYIKAGSAKEALRKAKTAPVDDVWIDDEWKKNNLPDAIGFNIEDHE